MHIYPTDFLTALATLEATRQKLIASASDTNEQTYEADLRSAASAGGEDATASKDAFEQELGDFYTKNITVMLLGGAITSKTLQQAPASEVERMQELNSSVSEWIGCVNGDTGQCMSSPTLPAVQPIPPISGGTGIPALVSKVSGLVEQTTFTSQPTRLFVLASSVCAASAPGPYYFLAPSTGGLPIAYVGDLYFEPATSTDPFSAYMIKTYGISYLLSNPTQFYQCPDVGADYGRVEAMVDLAAYAAAHPEIAPNVRGPLMSQAPLTESDTAAYLGAALTQEKTSPDADLGDIVRLALTFNDRAATLDGIIGDIARVNDNHVRASEQGIPFDLTARDLFLTHTALPTLYLADNPSSGETPVSLISSPVQNSLEIYLHVMKPYSTLMQTEPQSSLLHDIEATMSFETGHY
jgi:hypothetical protein